MNTKEQTRDLGIDSRIRRSRGRLARNTMAAAKVTREERAELDAAAKAAGKAFSEWAREALLGEARATKHDEATFTELIALRMLTSTVLRSLAIGERLSPESYAQILNEVRATKHEVAEDVITQYRAPSKER